jgi:hypothetical protein
MLAFTEIGRACGTTAQNMRRPRRTMEEKIYYYLLLSTTAETHWWAIVEWVR